LKKVLDFVFYYVKIRTMLDKYLKNVNAMMYNQQFWAVQLEISPGSTKQILQMPAEWSE